MSRGRGFRRNLAKLKIPARPGGEILTRPGGGPPGPPAPHSAPAETRAEPTQPQYSDYLVLEEAKSTLAKITDYTFSSHPDILEMCNTIRKFGQTFDKMKRDEMDRVFDGFRESIRNPLTRPSIRTHLLELVETRARRWTGRSHLAFYHRRKQEFAAEEPVLVSPEKVASDLEKPRVLLVDLEKTKPQFHPDRLDLKYSLHFTCATALVDQNRLKIASIESRTKTKVSSEKGPFGDVLNSSVKVWGASLNDIKNAAKMLNDELGSSVSSSVPPPSMAGDRFTSEQDLCREIQDIHLQGKGPPSKQLRRHFSLPSAQTLPGSGHNFQPASDNRQSEPFHELTTVFSHREHPANQSSVSPPANQEARYTPSPTNQEARCERRRPAPVPLEETPTIRLSRRDLVPVTVVSKHVQTSFLDQIVLRGLNCDGEAGDVVFISSNIALLKNIQRKLLDQLPCSGYERVAKPQPAAKQLGHQALTTVREPLHPGSTCGEHRAEELVTVRQPLHPGSTCGEHRAEELVTVRQPLHPGSTCGEHLAADRGNGEAASRRQAFNRHNSAGGMSYDRASLLTLARITPISRVPPHWSQVAVWTPDICVQQMTRARLEERLAEYEEWLLSPHHVITSTPFHPREGYSLYPTGNQPRDFTNGYSRENGYSRDQGNNGYSRDQGNNGYSRDQGNNGYSRDQGNNGYSRDQGSNAGFSRDRKVSGGDTGRFRDTSNGFSRDGNGFSRDSNDVFSRDGTTSGFSRNSNNSFTRQYSADSTPHFSRQNSDSGSSYGKFPRRNSDDGYHGDSGFHGDTTSYHGNKMAASNTRKSFLEANDRDVQYGENSQTSKTAPALTRQDIEPAKNSFNFGANTPTVPQTFRFGAESESQNPSEGQNQNQSSEGQSLSGLSDAAGPLSPDEGLGINSPTEIIKSTETQSEETSVPPGFIKLESSGIILPDTAAKNNPFSIPSSNPKPVFSFDDILKQSNEEFASENAAFKKVIEGGSSPFASYTKSSNVPSTATMGNFR